MVFCDTGTVEPTIDNWNDKYRVAPGFGLRIACQPWPAPIALDFAFPLAHGQPATTEVFSFFIGSGVGRYIRLGPTIQFVKSSGTTWKLYSRLTGPIRT